MAPVPARPKAKAVGNGGILDDVADEYGSDAAQLNLNERLQKRGRKAVLSHKARQRKDSNTEKGQAYSERLSGRVMKHNRRKERMDRLKQMY